MCAKTISRALFGAAILAAALSLATTAEAGLTLYASDVGAQQLFTLDPTTASATLVGGFGVTGMNGLAYDATHDILYGSDVTTNGLYRIDRVTGAATLVGGLGIPLVQALAYDPTTGSLYGAYGSLSAPSLYRINTTTGAATLIGAIGHTVSGLSFDPVSHLLYGSGSGDLGLFTIDATTGHMSTLISSKVGFNGLSFDPTTDKLYGVSNGGNTVGGGLAEGLYTVSTQTGTANLVGSLSLNNPLDIQFAFTPQGVPEPGSLALTSLGITILVASSMRRRRTSAEKATVVN